MLSIIIMYLMVLFLTQITYIVLSMSDEIKPMRKIQEKMVSKKATFLLAVAHAFYVTLFMVCVMMASTSFGWTVISTAIFYFGFKYNRRAFNKIIDKEVKEQV